MFESYIKPYLVKFCAKVSVEELCELIINSKDVYETWLEQFSNGDKPKIPEIASLLEGQIKREVKAVMAQVSPEHARLFEANPSWTEKQLNGLLNELIGGRQ